MRVLVAFSKFSLILHSRSWPCRSSVAIRALSSESSPSQSRGFLPRFHSQILPTSKDEVIRVQGDEFWHMTRVLRLGVNDRVELFDGMGGLVEGCIKSIDHNGSDIIVLEDPTILSPQSIQWHVFAAFGSLKGGRADWLVEKCTELGASSVTPLLTERSPTIAENRMDRFQRVILAAVKQCQRLHEMALRPPMKLHNFISVVSQSKASFLAAAEAIPILNVLSSSSAGTSGLLIVGPEGDFTEQELKLMTDAGATLVGLGPSRLRVETATVALLSTVMLWSETVISGTFYQQ
ncbi:16S rRNA (uracil1498-N3)-methyltransferase [Apostasia shenzhenica]|uniref:16S rRNA (uracil(1498)-N(3))-methyltransferase n=1 Tax=Apostasia shenzhenica TaxID=1088818 RepID=A0A2I0A4G3_9ASPA|nr:16S rRNA (uracil1498-N3)-methyltransferase [Apostasia shenzhenica]